jgi:hypothetical protein
MQSATKYGAFLLPPYLLHNHQRHFEQRHEHSILSHCFNNRIKSQFVRLSQGGISFDHINLIFLTDEKGLASFLGKALGLEIKILK